MLVVEPLIEIENYDGKKIMKNLERACRTCYRSENLINDDSYKKLLSNCITKGHESILEHEKITVRMICDIGVYKDLTRHRAGTSFSIESTRYCNYSKDKFTGNIKFIKPTFMSEENQKIWCDAMKSLEKYYMQMAKNANTTSDELRMLLPHSTAAEVTMTCNIRQWKHILNLRCSKLAHPAIRQLLIPLLLKFKKDMPEIFANVNYDEDFDKNKYAKLEVME